MLQIVLVLCCLLLAFQAVRVQSATEPNDELEDNMDIPTDTGDSKYRLRPCRI
jgi:hypothetical protein